MKDSNIKRNVGVVIVAMLILALIGSSIANDDVFAVEQYGDSIKVLESEEYLTSNVKTVTLDAMKEARTLVSNNKEDAVLYYNDGNALDCREYVSFDNDDSLTLTKAERIKEAEELSGQCKAMGYDYVDDGIDNSKLNVFGVYVYKRKDGTIDEITITSNASTMSLEEVTKDIDNVISNNEQRIESVAMAKASTKDSPHHYSISQTYKSGNTKVATITGNLTLHRKSRNAKINGKTGSVWDVDSFIQATGFNKRKIISKYVWLNTNQANQTLIKYTPIGDAGKRDGYDFTLSGGGVAPVSFTVKFGGGYKRTDYSSVGGKYGKWRYFTDTTGMKTRLTTQSGIRCSNIKGNIVIKAKCEIKTMHLVGRSYHSNTYTWAPAQYSLKDR